MRYRMPTAKEASAQVHSYTSDADAIMSGAIDVTVARSGSHAKVPSANVRPSTSSTSTHTGWANRNVVLEIVTPGYGGRGYPFTIATRPSGLAIYAIAGVENIRTQRFTPYIMGVARCVLASPRAAITNVVVNMNIPLDHVTPVEV